MPNYTVKVKWGKSVFNDVELCTDEDPLLFKAQLFALTGVQPERQKVMFKGSTLKDDTWDNVKVNDGAMVLLMGTKEEDVVKEPTFRPIFVEDLSETEVTDALGLPAGLKNLGNTCYLNATLQCLKSVPELRKSLDKFNQDNQDQTTPRRILSQIHYLYNEMDGGPAKEPHSLLQFLYQVCPRFAEAGPGGVNMQQDANECWTELIRLMQQYLPSLNDPSKKYKSFVDQYFGGQFNVEWKCNESDDEPVTHSREDFLQLSCFISQEVKYMTTGLKNKLQEQITKQSSILNRDAVFTKTAKIHRLPAYLTIQFVRFFYKESNKTNAKILKDVKFPMEYDAYDLCTKELQDKMEPYRNKFKELEELRVAEQLNQNNNTNGSKKIEYSTESFEFEDDIGSNNSGYYTLQAVLTHKGRSSSSGHYVGWVRHGDEGKWLMCDDGNVQVVSESDVLKLSGGGDWHCAYVLLYGPKILKIPKPDKVQPSS